MSPYVVISLSKIKISKAIHNLARSVVGDFAVVISLSKIKISKAIHNSGLSLMRLSCVVISLSKIKISKAIHNLSSLAWETKRLLSVCQR